MTANAAYLDSYKVEIYVQEWVDPADHLQGLTSAAWVDITTDIISPIKSKYGIWGNSITDRVADVGTLTFTLRNDQGCLGGVSGFWTPNSASGYPTGWAIESQVCLTMRYRGEDFCKFYGHIKTMKANSNTRGRRTVEVSCVDWMDYAANTPLKIDEIAYSKTIMDVVSLLTETYNKFRFPKHYIYSAGAQETFTSAFDKTGAFTTLVSEYQKVAMSELSYVYLRRDKVDGETLVVEGRSTRSNALSIIPAANDDCGLLEMEDGFLLLNEDGSSFVLNEATSVTFDNNMHNLDVRYDETSEMSKVKITVYPRKIDSAATTVLFNLDSPIKIAAGKSVSFYGAFKDPNGLATSVAGKDMVTPVATTDYLMYSVSDGTGTNLTASLTITAVYDVKGVKYTLTNTSGTLGYVTFLQARGKGVYLYNPVTVTAWKDMNTLTEDQVETSDVSLDMPYRDNIDGVIEIAQTIVAAYEEPVPVVEKMTVIANYQPALMWAFLNFDIGMRTSIKETQTAIDGDFFINGVEFTLNTNGILTFSWLLSNLDEFLT